MAAPDRQTLGKRGEDAALAYLQAHGYTLIERNWRCRSGELDLVMQIGDELVFVEVRARRSKATGTPAESLTAAKQARLITLGEHYLATLPEPLPWRIDVVLLALDWRGQVLQLEHLPCAVEGQGY